MIRTSKLLIVSALLAIGAGCSGGNTVGPNGKPAVVGGDKPPPVSAAAANKFKEGLDAMVAHNKARDWNDMACTQTAQLFLEAGAEEKSRSFNEAFYNAGLSYKACKKDAEAKAQFKKVLDSDPKFHRARVQLALYAFAESGEKNVDAAINELRQAAIVDAQFKNVEGLVDLSMMYMKRNNKSSDGDGADDFARAKKYLQSALAVDDGYMPAFNQLAIYYLQTAKEKAGKDANAKVATNKGKQKRVDTQALDLASLVCSQAIRKNPNYAAIHNTAGMIQVEAQNFNNAVIEFNAARKLDPDFYEAHMNYAAVNLTFRGFGEAAAAYRDALRMRPNDYDAHLGLALALRGQIDDSNFDKMVADSNAELEAAKKIAPERAETYYNQGILTQEYSAKGTGKAPEPELRKAQALYKEFVSKAGSAAEFADSVKSANDRVKEIDQIIDFNKQTEAQQKATAADAKQKDAEAEAKGENADQNGAPPENKDEKKDEAPKAP